MGWGLCKKSRIITALLGSPHPLLILLAFGEEPPD